MEFNEFGNVNKQDVGDYWENEEQDFTPELAESIREDESSQLEDILGIDLEVVGTEKSVGKYNLDILARSSEQDKKIVIENQLKESDHDHLGKSLAYAAGVDAEVIVWIAPEFNDEHKDAVQWINKKSRANIDLFCINLEVWKIDDSEPALRLNPIVEPSEWTKKVQRSEGKYNETEELREEFWTKFRDKIEKSNTSLRPRTPQPYHYYNNPIGTSEANIQFILNQREGRIYCGLLIWDNAELYESLKSEKEEIESEIDGDLEWIPPTETDGEKERAKIRIGKQFNPEDRESWDDNQEWLMEKGESFYNTFYDRV